MVDLQGPSPAWQLRVYPWISALGWILIGVSFIIGLFVLAPASLDYWGGNAKAVRDAAGAGSVLLDQLETLSVTPRWLEPLTFLGVASFMLGIALEFSSIPSILKNRGEVMRACFPLVVKHGS